MSEHADFAVVVSDLLRASHLMEPDEVPAAVRESAARLGATDARILLADYAQQELRLFVHPDESASDAHLIDTTVPGRVYRHQEQVDLVDDGVRRRLLPLVNGTHRIGVLELVMPADRPDAAAPWDVFTALVAELVIAKSAYGDTIEVTRRRQPMAVRAEAQRSLLPPLTLTSPRLLVTAMLEPSYEVAGDIFDYAVNHDVLHLAILDAMGHSLSATLIASVALAAYRNARREGGSLLDAWRVADDAVAAQFGGELFATAVFGQLDLVQGRMRSVSAGHPSALVVRDNRVVARCADDPTLPLGLGGDAPAVVETALQSGDRLLLFTDGIVESRSPTGEYFGEDHLVDQIGRELDSGLPPPEAVRRVVRAVVAHQRGALRDDATLMLAEWRKTTAQQ